MRCVREYRFNNTFLQGSLQECSTIGRIGNLQRLPTLQHTGFLTRTDLLGQAISLAIAERTYAWESGQPEQREPVYDARIISRMIRICQHRVLGWQQFFAYNNIVPFHLSYEALFNNPNQTCHDLCAYAGINVDTDFKFAQARVDIQRKKRNENWRKRFLNDIGISWLNLFIQQGSQP